MKKVASALGAVLLLSIFPALAATPPKSGASCSKAGLVIAYQGKNFTCIKSGKRLIWDKGVLLKQATPAISPKPSVTPTPLPTSSVVPNISPTPTLVPTPSPSQSAKPQENRDNLIGQNCDIRFQIIRNSSGTFTCSLNNGSTRWASYATAVNSAVGDSSTNAVEDPYSQKPCSNENEELRLGISTAPDYKCQRTSDGKLLWSKNNAVIKVRPTPASTNTTLTFDRSLSDIYARPTLPSDSIDLCKLKETSSTKGNVNTGFPLPQPYISNIGTIHMALVPIDFVDLPGEKDLASRIDLQMQNMSDWYGMVSEGKLKIEWTVTRSWIRLTGQQREYAVVRSGAYPDTANFWKKVIAEIDPKVDFKNIQVVNFLMPNGQIAIPEGTQSFPWEEEMQKYVTNEGPIAAFALPGTFFEDYRRQIWRYYSHEFGHVLGFAHPGNQGTYENPLTSYWDDILMYDMMGNQDGLAIGLLGWNRFLTSWLSDNQVFCTSVNDSMNFDLTLVPSYANLEGIKLALIKVSPSKVVAIESRRFNSFDCGAESIGDGVIAYSYDSTKGHDQASIHGAIPLGRNPQKYDSDCGPVTGINGMVTNLSMFPGDVTVIEGVRIQVIRSGRFDLIRIAKA